MIMWKSVLGLFPLIILFSFSSILIFADSDDDADMFNKQGIMNIELGNFEEAISYFDKALQIDPDNMVYLKNKGAVLILQEKYYEASIIFEKVLTVIPDDPIALHHISNFASKGFKPVDGMLEILVHNPQEKVVAYLKTTDIHLIDHPIAKETMDEWDVREIVTRDGQDYEVFQEVVRFIIEEEDSFSKMIWIDPDENQTIVFTKHHGFPVDKGDVVTLVFTIFSPIE